MLMDTLICSLIAFVIAEFYLPNNKYLKIFGYVVLAFASLIPFMNMRNAIITMIICVIYMICSLKNSFKLKCIFLVLNIVAVYFVKSDSNCVVFNKLSNFCLYLGLNYFSLMRYALLILIVIKPISLLIKLVLEKYSKKLNRMNNDDNSVGRIVGILERLIISIFLVLHQYSAVGLVLTAKSLARFDKISKDQNFAEYYLLGTLLSTLCVLIVKIIIIGF